MDIPLKRAEVDRDGRITLRQLLAGFLKHLMEGAVEESPHIPVVMSREPEAAALGS